VVGAAVVGAAVVAGGDVAGGAVVGAALATDSAVDDGATDTEAVPGVSAALVEPPQAASAQAETRARGRVIFMVMSLGVVLLFLWDDAGAWI
jgi:hypothetical protein